MFCLGGTFPGKNIILYNYCMEIVNPKNKQLIVNLINFLECTVMMWGTFYYQRISKDWIFIQIFCTGITVFSIFYMLTFF